MLILLAYLLVTTGKVGGQSLTFQLINLFGASGFIINAWWHGAIPVVALNLVWLLVALTALVRLASLKARASATPE